MQAGKYRLIKLIGRGGMGEVWEGTLAGEQGFARRVAIKKMIGEHATGFESRFMDEARIASRLHHANIVSVLDFGVEAGSYFQVLELIDGIDARHVFEQAKQRGEPLPPELALHLCIETAHGLASAHAARDDAGRPLHIVHRDVSLENILVSWEGDVKLSDFGVAKARDRASLTAGGVVGKPAYMAPEQATGGEVDGRTDVFALGCALHALFTGVTPLAGEDRLAQLLTGQTLPVAPSIPEDIAQVIAKAISRSKGERYASADAMAEAMAKLRHQRMSQDPRAALREFLSRLRPKPKRAMGALDALLAPPEEEPQAAAASPAPLSSIDVAATRMTPVKPRRSAVLPLAGLSIAALAAGAGAYLFLGRVEPVVPVVQPAQPLTVVRAEEREPVKPEPPPPEKVVEPQVPVPQPKVAKKVQPKAAPVETALGVLVVGGAGAQRAKILVDGANVGFAPKRLELVVGEHELVLLKDDGQRVGPHRVDITERNTDLAPAKWLVSE